MPSASMSARAIARASSLFVAILVTFVTACGDPTGTGEGGGGGSGTEILGPPVTAGMFHIGNALTGCGVTVAGKAYCWGEWSAWTTEPGSAPLSNLYSPAPVADGMVFASINNTTYSTCALTLDGTAYCWGMNNVGQLGNGAISAGEAAFEPQPVAGGHRFSQLVRRGGSTIGLTTAGKLIAWGENTGNLGDGTTTDRPTPVAIAPAETFTTLATSDGLTVAITTDGEAWAWGPGYPSLNLPGSATPAPLASASGQVFSSVAAGYYSVLLLNGAGEAYALGADVGNGGEYNGLVRVAPGLTFTEVATSLTTHLGLTADGVLYAWGRNNWGQVGDGSTTPRATPVAVGGALRFRQIAAEDEFSAALTTSGELYFWGRNQAGIFANGVASPSTTGPFSATPTGPRSRGLSLVLTPASPTINAGETLNLGVSVIRVGGGFATSGVNIGLPGAVTVSVRDLPSGISASFTPSATIPADQSGTVLRLQASSGLTGGVGSFGIRAQASNMPTQPEQPMSVLKVSSSGDTGLDLVCSSGATPASFPAGYHCMVNSSGATVPGKFAVPTLTSSPWWVDTGAEVCVSWRNDGGRGVSTARFKGGFGGGTTVTSGHWGLLVGRAGLPEGVPGARYLFTSNLDGQTQLLTFNDLSSSNVINNYDFTPSASCPW